MSDGWSYVIAAFGATGALYAGYFVYLKGQLRDLAEGRDGRSR
jgi:hypothetical protein